MDRNAYVGLKNAHIAPVIDEDQHTYETPVAIGLLGGIMEIALNAQTSNNPIYAADITWIDSETDNGFEGTVRLANIWGNPTLRALFAPLCGYEFASDGTLLGSSGKPRRKFALMAEPSGVVSNKRECYLLCQFGKPNRGSQTKGESGNHAADEFPITARPVTLSSGWTGSFYENIPSDGSAYTNFYNSVRTNLAPATNENVKLSALTIGTLALTPAFDENTTTYTVTTENATDAVSATAANSSATVAITVNGDSHTSGESATWSTGQNVVTVLVTKSGAAKAYTVVVTKSSE